jgi:uncharacterized membrane protein
VDGVLPPGRDGRDDMTMLKPRTLAIYCLAAVLCGGCASSPNQGARSSASDAGRTRTEGAVTGAVVGALLGMALGGDNRGKGALVGAAVGAGAGYLVGNEIAKRKQKYARDEDFLDSEIAVAREYNATARRYNQQLRRDIAALDRKTRLAESRYRAGLTTKDELASQRKEVQKEIAAAKKVHGDLKKEYEIKVEVAKERRARKGGNDPYVKQLEQEIAALKRNMDQLQAQSVQLAQIDERLTL